VSFWQFLLPGFRNPLLDPLTYEKTIGKMVCISRFTLCDSWKKEGECDIPALKDFMYYNCYRSCTGCVRTADTPIDGGWSHWTRVTECSAKCGGGFVTFYRFCTFPPVMYEGKPCSGKRVRKRRCRTQKCKGQLEKEKDECHDLNVDCGEVGWNITARKHVTLVKPWKHVPISENECTSEWNWKMIRDTVKPEGEARSRIRSL